MVRLTASALRDWVLSGIKMESMASLDWSEMMGCRVGMYIAWLKLSWCLNCNWFSLFFDSTERGFLIMQHKPPPLLTTWSNSRLSLYGDRVDFADLLDSTLNNSTCAGTQGAPYPSSPLHHHFTTRWVHTIDICHTSHLSIPDVYCFPSSMTATSAEAAASSTTSVGTTEAYSKHSHSLHLKCSTFPVYYHL